MPLYPDEEWVGWNFDIRRWTFGVQYDGEDLYFCLGPVYYLFEVDDNDLGTPRKIGRQTLSDSDAVG